LWETRQRLKDRGVQKMHDKKMSLHLLKPAFDFHPSFLPALCYYASNHKRYTKKKFPSKKIAAVFIPSFLKSLLSLKTATRLFFFYFTFSFYPCHAFQKAETGFFTFYFKQSNYTLQQLIQNADSMANEISESMGFKLKEKVSVYIVKDYTELKPIQPPGARIPFWAIGVAFPSKNLIFLLKKNQTHLAKTFRHEVSHILLGHAFKGKQRIPRWLDEGLAMIQADEWSLSRLSKMTSGVLTGSLIPMDDIVSSFPIDLREAELAYCQSFYFISFLKGKFGSNAFKDFLKEYSRHKDFQRAIRKTYDIGWHQMEELWLDYLKLRFSWIPIITSTSTLWFVTSLIFIFGYIRKKQKARQKMEKWEVEEAVLFDKDDATFH